MSNACTTDQYFSGQGALLLAERDGSGNPKGFREVGNVSSLIIAVETTTFEHKTSCDGTRGIDLELVQEVNVTATFIMESLSKENLAVALYGTSSEIAGASASDEAHIAYLDKWTALDNIKVSAVVVTNVGGSTTYTLGTDYLENLEAGSIKPLSTGTIVDLAGMEIDYTYSTQDDVQAVTSSAPPERYARFEGLNTADGNKEMVVEMFKLSMQPLAELALINEEISQMEVTAKVLTDSLVSSGSTYFKIRKIK